MSIPYNDEKGNMSEYPAFKSLFWPFCIILAALFGWGAYLLNGIQAAEPTIIITEQPALTYEAVTFSTTTRSKNTEEKRFVASKNGKSYYVPACSTVKRIDEKNKVWFSSKEEAEKAGYLPAKNCKQMQ